MSECSRVVQCKPTDVFDVLSDGWTYALWVVGAARIREVDPAWPAAGSQIHHSVGAWPVMLDDTTESKGAEPPHRLRLRARAWPTGEAEVEFLVEPHDAGCVVTIREHAAAGPATLIPAFVQRPMLKWRNDETLRRLAFLAAGRSRL
jgi:Polyketide cyclase / dehydrase and lipid transport